MNKKSLVWLLLIPAFFFLPSLTSAKMYQWVDEKGEVHISDAPTGDITNAPSEAAAQEPSVQTSSPYVNETQPQAEEEEYVIIPLGKRKHPLTQAIPPSAIIAPAPAVEKAPAPPSPIITERKPVAPTPPAEVVTPLAKKPVEPAPEAAKAPEPKPAPAAPKEAPKPAETVKAPEPKPAPEAVPAPEEMPEEFMIEPGMEFDAISMLPIPPEIIAMFVGFIAVILAVFAVIYLFYSFCIFKIGRKLGVDKPWIAFIPVVGNWTLVQAGSKSALWFALMLMPWVITAITVPLAIFMPDLMMLVGAPLGIASLLFSLLSIVAFFVVWAGVIGNLGFNKLLVLVFLVPFGALILPAYFAFSKTGGGAGAPSEAGEAGFGEETYTSEESSSEDIAGDALASLGISDEMLVGGGDIDESRLLPGGTPEEAPAEEPSFEMPVEEGPSMDELLEQHSFGEETAAATGESAGAEGLEPTSFAGEEPSADIEDMDKTLVDQSGIGGEPSMDIGGFSEGDFGELPIDSGEPGESEGEDVIELDDSLDISGIEEPSSDEQEQTIIDHGIGEAPGMDVNLESDMDLAGLDEISLDESGEGEKAGEITLDEESLDAPLDMGDFSADFDIDDKAEGKGFDQTIIDRGMDVEGSDEPLDLDIDEPKE